MFSEQWAKYRADLFPCLDAKAYATASLILTSKNDRKVCITLVLMRIIIPSFDLTLLLFLVQHSHFCKRTMSPHNILSVIR